MLHGRGKRAFAHRDDVSEYGSSFADSPDEISSSCDDISVITPLLPSSFLLPFSFWCVS
jgi:hypothetical protein